MSTQKNTIIDMRPVSTLDDPHAPKTYIPVRTEEPTAGELAPREAGTLRPVTPRTQTAVTGTHLNRAFAFSVKTWQLSLIVGVAVWLAARILGGHPLLSLTAILWLVSGFGLVWAGAYFLDTVVSPEGAELIDTLLFWRFMGREQRERHERLRKSIPSTTHKGE